MNNVHIPVLLQEMLEAVSPRSGETYLDGTFGAGGYSTAILKSADCKVYAIDRDDPVKQYAKKLYSDFLNKFELLIGKFSDMDILLQDKKVDAVILDLGVSSMQLETADRGFSFMKDGPLDMRMSNDNNNKVNAAILVNAFREEEIANIIYQYSNERYSRKIAAAIVRFRDKNLIKTTTELAEIIRSVIPRRRNDKIDPATRTFQAIRIWVNDELAELKKGIDAAVKLLNIGGRLIIISFHSLEDKIVKEKFNLLCGKEQAVSRYFPTIEKDIPANFVLLNKKVIKSSEEEINSNPRSRSARLRAITRIL